MVLECKAAGIERKFPEQMSPGEVPLYDNEWWHSGRFRPCRKTSIDDLSALLKEREREEV
jgi:hypothetical protein